MLCFELIKRVLDEIYATIPGREEAKDCMIRTRLNELSEAYTNLTRAGSIGPSVDYGDPVIRFAYIYRYVASHANLVYNIMANCSDLREIRDMERISVTALGGGPGSDVLGLIKLLHEREYTGKINCLVYDREESWAESWQDINDKIDNGFQVNASFQRFDVTDPATWRQKQKYLQSELIIMTYFISEVYTQKELAEPFFINLFTNARPGSLFLYIDNNSRGFTDWFDALCKKCKLHVIKKDTACKTIEPLEQKDALGEYFAKFDHPKLTANIAYRVCRRD